MQKNDNFSLMYLLFTIIVLLIFATAGYLDQVSYENRNREIYKNVSESIASGEIKPNYINTGKIFNFNGKTFVESDDGKVYLCVDYSK
jgi:hypothetical protein